MVPDVAPEVEAIVAAPTRRRLGDLLIDDGLITTDQLHRALEIQRAQGGRLGEVLVASGMVSESDIRRVLAEQFGIPFVDLMSNPPDYDVATMLPRAVCERALALPVQLEGETLVVAMANPSDLFAMDDIRVAARRPVRSVLADAAQLQAWIARSFEADEVSALDEAVSDSTEEVDDIESVDAARNAPIVRFVDGLLARAVRDRASDVHVESVEAGLQVRFRVDGVLRNVMDAPRQVRGGVISRLKIMADLDISERRLPQDGRSAISVDGRRVDLRVATMPTMHGESVVLRLLERSARRRQTLADLGYTEENQEVVSAALGRRSGLVVACGPTGSGKTTTLGAMLGELVRPELAVVTIEDPVETDIAGVKQMQVNPRTGFTFARALRSTLRADPDVILVGEVRDAETAKVAAEAAMTGHLVLTSLHTNDAASAAIRLVEMGVEPYLVSSSLICAVSQRLVRRLCTACRQPYRPDAAELMLLGIPEELHDAPDIAFFHAEGCGDCQGTGYRDRIAIAEVMPIDRAIADLILHGATSEAVADQAYREGVVSMPVDGAMKVLSGQTDIAELIRAGIVATGKSSSSSPAPPPPAPPRADGPPAVVDAAAERAARESISVLEHIAREQGEALVAAARERAEAVEESARERVLALEQAARDRADAAEQAAREKAEAEAEIVRRRAEAVAETARARLEAAETAERAARDHAEALEAAARDRIAALEAEAAARAEAVHRQAASRAAALEREAAELRSAEKAETPETAEKAETPKKGKKAKKAKKGKKGAKAERTARTAGRLAVEPPDR